LGARPSFSSPVWQSASPTDWVLAKLEALRIVHAYLAEKTAGMDFRVEDHVDAARFNLILWQAMKGENVPYPTVRTGTDLRKNRETLLKHWRESRTKAFGQRVAPTQQDAGS